MSTCISSLGCSVIQDIAYKADKIGNGDGWLEQGEEYQFFLEKIDEALEQGTITKEEFQKYLHQEIKDTENYSNCRFSNAKQYKEKNSFKNVAKITLGLGAMFIGGLKIAKLANTFKSAGIAGGIIGTILGGIYFLENKIEENSNMNKCNEYKQEAEQLKLLYKKRFGEEYIA